MKIMNKYYKKINIYNNKKIVYKTFKKIFN